MPATLFVSRDKRNPERYDVGSVLCLDLVRYLRAWGYEDHVTVQECSAATPGRPAWLTGTPTIHNEEGVYTGYEAIAVLQETVIRVAQTRRDEGGAGRRGGRQRRNAPQPSVQLRPEGKRATILGDEGGDDLGEGADGHVGVDAQQGLLPADAVSTEQELWESTLGDEDEADEAPSAKLSQDDLQRLLQQRAQSGPSPATPKEGSAPKLSPAMRD